MSKEVKSNERELGFVRAKSKIEKIDVKSNTLESKSQEYLDLIRTFSKVFNTDEGKKVLQNLDDYSHRNFPNYDNVNATYSKIGEQTLVAYIRAMLLKAKKQ